MRHPAMKLEAVTEYALRSRSGAAPAANADATAAIAELDADERRALDDSAM